MKPRHWLALTISLIGAGTASVRSASAAPRKTFQTAISQIVITQYTGSDGSNRSADPIYRISLRRDGTAIYIGSKTYMKRVGRYHGKVGQKDFLRLANLFQQNEFQKWPSSYNQYSDRNVAKEKFEITYGSRKKTVVAFSDSGPRAVRRASNIAYGLLWKIQWNKVSSSDAFSEYRSSG